MTSKGYAVTLLTDLTTQEMTLAVNRFVREIQSGDAVVVYYGGHGWSDGRENFLVGVGTERQSDIGDLEAFSLPVQNGANGIVDRIEQTEAALRVIILDACRENPFLEKKGTRTIAQAGGLVASRAEGTFVVFSAGTGQLALDGLGDDDPNPNGLFMRVLLPLLNADLPLLEVVKAAQVETRNLARTVNHDQLPAYYDGVAGTICLSEACASQLAQ